MTRSIDNLAALWSSLDSLLSGLSDEEWAAPTGCPGWSVQDNVSHLIDYESRALGRPGPEHAVADDAVGHLKNDMGKANEVGVDYRRSWPPAKVLDEFREVTGARLAQLRSLTEEDLARRVSTPVGEGTAAEMLTLRVMDTWTHEQDIRRAVGRPGHVDGPAADEAVAYYSQYLGFVVGKRAGAPDGSTVLFALGDRPPVAIAVVDGKGRAMDELPSSPTAALRMPVTTFAALVSGRSDAPDDVEVAGDEALGQKVVASMGIMP